MILLLTPCRRLSLLGLCLLLAFAGAPAPAAQTGDAATEQTQTNDAQDDGATQNQPADADADDDALYSPRQRPDAKPPIPGSENLSGTLTKLVMSLAIVIGLIVAFGYFAKRILPRQFGIVGGEASMRLVQNLALGPNRFVSLVEVDGRRFLLGVTENQINLLNALDEQTFSQEMAAAAAPPTVRELMEEES